MADSAPGGPRFERDLRELRQQRGISIGYVQQQTRIPADVLERFENGRLVGDPNFNEVYLKALLRAYAEAVGIAPQQVLSAYEAQKGGSYDGRLLEGSGSRETRTEAPVPVTPVEEVPAEEEDSPIEAPPADKPPVSAAAPPAVAALRSARTPEPTQPAASRPAAKSRVVSRESVTSSTTSIEASWGLIIGGSLVAILVLGGILWLLLRTDSPERVDTPATAQATEEQAPGEQDPEAATPTDDPAPVGDAPQLQTPISVTLTAQGRSLQGFRVTAEPDVRRPYWLEEGQSQTFQSETAVILWGEESGGGFNIPSAAQVELQGYRWNPGSGTLTINQERGQALLDSLHRTQAATP